MSGYEQRWPPHRGVGSLTARILAGGTETRISFSARFWAQTATSIGVSDGLMTKTFILTSAGANSTELML